MDTGGRPSPGRSPPTKWSLYAGLYMFACGTATAYLLHDLLGLLAEVLGLPAAFSMGILASPALVFGAIVWWAVVERRGSYTYFGGGAFGLFTALFTGLLWVARFVSVWGIEMGLAVGALVGFVLAMTTAAGVLAGPALMYARRRADDRRTGADAETGAA